MFGEKFASTQKMSWEIRKTYSKSNIDQMMRGFYGSIQNVALAQEKNCQVIDKLMHAWWRPGILRLKKKAKSQQQQNREQKYNSYNNYNSSKKTIKSIYWKKS